MDHATIPLASAHGSLGAWFSVKVGEHGSRDPCRSSGVVGPYSPLTTYRWALLTTLEPLPCVLFEPLVVVRQVGLSSSPGRLCEGEFVNGDHCTPNTGVPLAQMNPRAREQSGYRDLQASSKPEVVCP